MSKLSFYILSFSCMAVVAGLGFNLGQDLYYALTSLVGICRG